MIQIDKEFLRTLREYVVESLESAIYHNSPGWEPGIQADLDKIDELLNSDQWED